ncbi:MULTISPECIES: hypothetical protein [unclassified Halomonas]|uniref:hypothetical protein n=1 Tax=unclassified Halomonas TaxID=2609666 RepID=UPI004034E46A
MLTSSMPPRTLPFTDLEEIYERLAETLDGLPETQESLFLTQLALSLAHRIPDVNEINAAIEEARQGVLATSS